MSAKKKRGKSRINSPPERRIPIRLELPAVNTKKEGVAFR